ncbi:MAG: outer membrane lipoprotein carrier protein LolA [Luteolibacter sp.]
MSFRPLALAFLLSVPAIAQDATPLKIALEKQAKHKTVSVDVRQTKKIPALNEPIVQKGHLWLQPGKAFRWELGKPLTQSAVFDGSKVYMMDEEKKTAKSLDPDDRQAKPLLLMLGIGEGATFDGLTESFTIADTNTVREHFVVSLVPKGSLKRAMKHMVMQVNTRTSFLERIEWVQKDGTVVITEFYPPKLNGSLPSGIFNVNRDGYKWE